MRQSSATDAMIMDIAQYEATRLESVRRGYRYETWRQRLESQARVLIRCGHRTDDVRRAVDAVASEYQSTLKQMEGT